MASIEKVRNWILGLCGLVIVAGLGSWLVFSFGGQEMIGASQRGTLEPLAFTELDYDTSQDGYLMCSALCAQASADAPAPVFSMTGQALRLELADMTDQMVGVRVHHFDFAINQFDFSERLPGETYPAAVSVRVTDLGAGRSSVSIYSRKPIGDDSKAENRARVERWIKALQDRLVRSGKLDDPA